MNIIFDPSLVLSLPLYELDGSSFMSRDAYGHTCTATGVSWTPGGRSFDGIDDYIGCGAKPILDITGRLTIEAWVRGGSWTDNAWYTIACKGGFWTGGGSEDGYELYLMSNRIRIDIWNNGVAKALDITRTYNQSSWNQVAATNDGANLRLYLNGNLIGTGAGGVISSSSNDLQIGRRYGGHDLFVGSMGEVRVYNRDLTPLEVQNNYMAAKWRYR